LYWLHLQGKSETLKLGSTFCFSLTLPEKGGSHLDRLTVKLFTDAVSPYSSHIFQSDAKMVI